MCCLAVLSQASAYDLVAAAMAFPRLVEVALASKVVQEGEAAEQSQPSSKSGQIARGATEWREAISFGDFFTAPNTINLLNRTLFV